MTPQDPGGPPAHGRPATPTAAEAAARERLACLLGRLLAEYWLRSGGGNSSDPQGGRQTSLPPQ
jgi:hypothetical protein